MRRGRLSSIDILGRDYRIVYVKSASEVDPQGRDSLWGHVDYWNREIRIYDNGRSERDIFETIMHEILHALDNDLHLGLKDHDGGEGRLHRLSVGLADTLRRNKIIG